MSTKAQKEGTKGRKFVNQQINLAETEHLEIVLTDAAGSPVAIILLDRTVEETPQLNVNYFDKEGNMSQSNTIFDVDA